jgi:phenylacetate-coenzyme A ligase PaaK-like adenylate-forming protein
MRAALAPHGQYLRFADLAGAPPTHPARAIDGRADDVLRLGGIAVHPLQFEVVTADRRVREFQVVQDFDRLRLRVPCAPGRRPARPPSASRAV